jgi:predicted RNA-binding protein with PUA-like domain
VTARWLVKTEPGAYSFADLLREGTTRWEGVKNALALRHLRAMAAGDGVLIYETGGVKAVVGTATVARGAYPDPRGKDPKLVVVDLRAGRALGKPVTLAAIKADPAFRDFALVRMGRLSVMPVTAAQWDRLLA